MELIRKVYGENGSLFVGKGSGREEYDNEPRKGFKITGINYDRRNAMVFKDGERGDFDVDRYDMFNLFSKITLVNNEIQEECVLAKDGPKFVIIPITDPQYLELYRKLEEEDDLVQNSVTAKECEVLDILNVKIDGEMREFIYGGRVNNLSAWSYTGKTNIEINPSRFMFIEKRNESRYKFLFLAKFPSIVVKADKRTDLFVSETALYNKVNDLLHKNMDREIFKDDKKNNISIDLSYPGYSRPSHVSPFDKDFMLNQFKESLKEDIICE